MLPARAPHHTHRSNTDGDNVDDDDGAHYVALWTAARSVSGPRIIFATPLFIRSRSEMEAETIVVVVVVFHSKREDIMLTMGALGVERILDRS